MRYERLRYLKESMMTYDPPAYDTAAIRELLTEAFTFANLRRFCEDRPVFRHIVCGFGPDHGLDDMVDEVIDYCRTHLLFTELLAGVQETNPRQYARFESHLDMASLSAGEQLDGAHGTVPLSKYKYRRDRIGKWRQAVENHDWRTPFGATAWYAEVQPHLEPELRRMIETPRMFIVGSEMRDDPAVRYMLLDEISRLEIEWDLI